MSKKSTLPILLCFAFSASCLEEPQGQAYLGDAAQETMANLKLAGYSDAAIELSADGTVIVGGDAIVTLAASREMLGLLSRDVVDPNGSFRQHSTNLVGQAIDRICVVADRAQHLDNSEVFDDAVDDALVAYAGQNLRFRFDRIALPADGEEDLEICDARITFGIIDGEGAVAGFPAGGQPFNQVNLGRGLLNFGAPVVTFVVMHELGHTIGLRHSDYFNRRISCGVEVREGIRQDPDEGHDGDSAVHIPGTSPVAQRDGSVMNACFNGNSNPAFSADDGLALQTLYGPNTDFGPAVNSCRATGRCGGNIATPSGCFCDDGCRAIGDCCPDAPC